MNPRLVLVFLLTAALTCSAQMTAQGGTTGAGTGAPGTPGVTPTGPTTAGTAAGQPGAANPTGAPAAGAPAQPGSAQNQNNTGIPQPGAAPTPNNGVVVAPGVTNTGGFVSNTAAPSAPGLITPIVTLTGEAPTAGVSNNGRAGITDQPEPATIPSSTTTQTVVSSPTSPPTPMGAPALDMGSADFISGSDSGSTYAGAATSAGAPAAMSLGEIAAQYRTSRGIQVRTDRVFTNDNLPRAETSAPEGAMTQGVVAMARPTAPEPGAAPADLGSGEATVQDDSADPAAQHSAPRRSAQPAGEEQVRAEGSEQAVVAEEQQLPATSTTLPLLFGIGAMLAGGGMIYRFRG